MRGSDGDDDCGLCYSLADIHCRLYGDHQPAYCDLKTQYLVGGLTGDDLIVRLADLDTTEQAERVEDELRQCPPPSAAVVRAARESARAAGAGGSCNNAGYA